MAKLIGLLMLVFGIWASVKIYTEGPRSAFGGVLAEYIDSESPRAEPQKFTQRGRASLVQRTGAAVTQAHLEAAQRRERLMGD